MLYPKWRRMIREYSRAKYEQDELVSPYEPIRLYNILHSRFQSNPSFLSRCLSYKMIAKTEKKSAGRVVFKYKDRNKTLPRTEITENWSCPFCFMMRCGSSKGLEFHLNASHDLFEFKFELRVSEEEQTVNVSERVYAPGSEEEENHKEISEPYSFCSKPRIRRQRAGRNNAKRQKEILDSPNLANDTENEILHLNETFSKRHKKDLLS